MQFAICTKSMELFKLYSKEKTNFFCLIKLLFIKVRCLMNVILKGINGILKALFSFIP